MATHKRAFNPPSNWQPEGPGVAPRHGEIPWWVNDTYLETMDTLNQSKLDKLSATDKKVSILHCPRFEYRSYFPFVATAIALFVPLVFLLRVAGAFVPFVGLVTLVLSIVGFAFTYRKPIAMVFAAGMIFGACLSHIRQEFMVLLFLFALGSLLFTARTIALNYIEWLTAQPGGEKERKEYWTGYVKEERSQMNNIPVFMVKRFGLLLAFLFFVMAAWGSAIDIGQTYLPGCYLLGALCGIVTLLIAAPIVGDIAAGSKWRDALSFWINYEPHAFAPGVYRSEPTGDQRRFTVWLLLAGICATLLPLAAFFPVTIFFPEPWITAAPLSTKIQSNLAEEFVTKDDDEILSYMPAHVTRSEISDVLKDPKFLYSGLGNYIGPDEATIRRYHQEIIKLLSIPKELPPRTDAHIEEPNAYRQNLADMINAGRIRNERLTSHKFILDNHVGTKYVLTKRQFPDSDYDDRNMGKVTSHSWLAIALPGLGGSRILPDLPATGTGFFITTFLMAISLSFLVPPFVCWAGFVSSANKIVSQAASDLPHSDLVPNEQWEAYVSAMQSSENNIERNSLFMGIQEYSDYPVMIPTRAFKQHAHFMGASGMGKTTGMSGIQAQLIRMSARNRAEQLQNPETTNEPFSVVIVDLKGDDAMFHGAKIETELANEKYGTDIKFKWFTNGENRSSYIFNPFTQKHIQGQRLNYNASLFARGLGVSNDGDANQAFWSGVNLDILIRLLQAFGDNISSFAELEFVTRPENRSLAGNWLNLSRDELDRASHVIQMIRAVAITPAFNLSPQNNRNPDYANALANQIDVSEIITKPSVVYFSLRAGEDQIAAANLSRLFLAVLLNGANRIQSQKIPTVQTFLFVDEFQQMVTENIEIFFAQARSHDIACIFANQDASQLSTNTADLRPTIFTNTFIKQYFSSDYPEDQEHLARSSGDTLRYFMMQPPEDATIDNPKNFQGVFGNRYTVNDFIRMSADHEVSMLRTKNSGFALFDNFPFEIRVLPHITLEEMKRREKRIDWPEDNGETITASEADYETLRNAMPQVPRRRPDPASAGTRPHQDRVAPGQPSKTVAEDSDKPVDAGEMLRRRKKTE